MATKNGAHGRGNGERTTMGVRSDRSTPELRKAHRMIERLYRKTRKPLGLAEIVKEHRGTE